MTLADFTRDVVPILQLLVAVLGLVSVFLIFWQIRQTNLWNKLNSPLNFHDNTLYAKLQKDVYAALKKIEIDSTLNDKLNEQQAEKIMGNTDSFMAVTNFINYYENICSGINIGSVDKDCAYAVHVYNVINTYKKYFPLIEKIREDRYDDEIYIEIEKVAIEWERKHLTSVKKQKKKVNELKKRLKKSKGVKSKV